MHSSQLLTFGQYDPDVENACVIHMSTTDGGGCTTSMNCEGGDNYGKKVGDWQVCYLNGNQFFTHPDVGDCKSSNLQKTTPET
jgi:hypothetical protein